MNALATKSSSLSLPQILVNHFQVFIFSWRDMEYNYVLFIAFFTKILVKYVLSIKFNECIVLITADG